MVQHLCAHAIEHCYIAYDVTVVWPYTKYFLQRFLLFSLNRYSNMLALKTLNLHLLDKEENKAIYLKSLENFDLDLGLETNNYWNIIIHCFKG